MELIKNRIGSYSATTDIATMHEESLDAIVPDTLADIEAILCCFGNVDIKEKVAQTDRVMVSGSINATMVYAAENDNTPICLVASIPFAALVEAKGCRPQDTICVQCVLQKIEGCILNPRKFSVRAQIAMNTRVYSKTEADVCTGIISDNSEGAQTLIENHTFNIMPCVREKSISIREDVRTVGDCTAADKIISTKAEFFTEDIRVVSGKVMLRGSVKNDVIILLEDGSTASQSFSLPYSQIIEVDSAESDDDAKVTCYARSCNIDLADSDNGTVFKCEVSADVVVCISREITTPVLSDGFSTVCACKMNITPILLDAPMQKYQCSTEIKAPIETNCTVQNLIDTSICASNVCIKNNEAYATVCIMAIYKASNGCLGQVCHNEDVCVPLPAVGGKICNIAADCEALSIVCNGGCLSLCGTVNFEITARKCPQVNQICAWEMDMGNLIAKKTNASLILRRAQSDENVWQLARDYSTSVGEINAANKLEDGEAIAAGKLIMIPFSKI